MRPKRSPLEIPMPIATADSSVILKVSPDPGCNSTCETVLPAREIRTFTNLGELEQIRKVWSDWPGHRDSDVDFVMHFIRTSPEAIRPHVVVLYRHGVPEAMLLGRLERTKLTFKIGYLKLLQVSARILIFGQGGARGNISDANAAELVRSVQITLAGHEADLALFHQVEAGSPLFHGILSGTRFSRRDHIAAPEPRYTMTLPATAEKLYESFSRSVRHGIRQKTKRLNLQFAGRVRMECIQTPAELERAIPDIEAVASKTYQRGLGVGFVDTPQIRERFHFFARQGWLRVYILYIDDKPCSFLTGTIYRGVYVSDFTGYDPAFRDYSVGSVLEMAIFEHLCQQGVHEVEFGTGHAEYKRRLSNRQTMEANLHIFAPTVKGVALNSLRTASIFSERFLKKVLDRADLLPVLKKLWRTILTPSAQQERDAQIDRAG